MVPLWSINAAWFFASVMLMFGLRRMSAPERARSGLHIAAFGVVIAVVAAVLSPEQGGRLLWVVLAMGVGGAIGLLQAGRVDLTQVPRVVALYNGLGGGAAAMLGARSLMMADEITVLARSAAVFGLLAGSISLAGSILAFMRLRGIVLRRRRQLEKAQLIYVTIAGLVAVLALLLIASAEVHPVLLSLLSFAGLAFGVAMTLPVARPELPVLISLFNAMTGLAVGFEGYVLSNPIMMIGGMLVFAAGLLLTRQISRAANRRLSQILFSGLAIAGVSLNTTRDTRLSREVDPLDAAISLAYADRVVVIPGYGMAVAQAQHKLRELTQLLDERGVQTLFAIHPVAGRMPGHMNVLLAEAGVPDEKLRALDDINGEFKPDDVVLVVGANDIVNPHAGEAGHALHGLPIFDLSKAGAVVVLDQIDREGHAGVENPIFERTSTRFLSGDARESVQALIASVKTLA